MFTKIQFTRKFANKLKQLRQDKQMSQEELAHQAELYRTYINHLECARYSPSGYVIFKIAKALNVTASQLMNF